MTTIDFDDDDLSLLAAALDWHVATVVGEEQYERLLRLIGRVRDARARAAREPESPAP